MTPWGVHSGPLGDLGLQYVHEGAWEWFSACLAPAAPFGGSLDFWRIDPRGAFYHLDALEDDFHAPRGIPPGTQLDFLLQIRRVTEYLTAAQSFALGMGCEATKTSLACAFRWTGLRGRSLVSRSDPWRRLDPRTPANQDQVTTTVAVPLDTPPAGLAPHVQHAVWDLFLLFGGLELSAGVIEGIVNQTLAQRY